MINYFTFSAISSSVILFHFEALEYNKSIEFKTLVIIIKLGKNNQNQVVFKAVDQPLIWVNNHILCFKKYVSQFSIVF